MPLPPDLKESYLRTAYTARTDDGSALVIRVGRRHPELDALLAEAQASSWAFITAWNPWSRQLSEEANRLRQSALLAEIGGRFRYFKGEGIAEDGVWVEPSLLILGISRAEALRLAEQFEQNAIVVAERGGAAELAWTRGHGENA